MPKKSSLFSCVAVPTEKLEISLRIINPITKISKLTEEKLELINKLEISNEEKHLLRDIFCKGKIFFKNFKKLNEKEKILLSLMSGITKLIDEEFINEKKIVATTENLKELIEKYKTENEKIDWNKFQTIPPLPPTIFEAPIQPKNSSENSAVLQELKAKQNLKKNIKEIPESMQIDKLKNVPSVFAIKTENLDRTRLKPISLEKEKSSELEKEEPSEFALAFDEFQKNKIKKQEENLKLEWLNKVSNYEKVRLSQIDLDLQLRRLEALRRHISSSEFNALEFEIIENACMNSQVPVCQNINTFSIIEEELDNKTIKYQAPLSLHFKSANESINANDKLIIVEAILKPTA